MASPGSTEGGGSYPLLSWPVALGTIGGVMIVTGTFGLLYLKRRSDAVPAAGDECH